MTPGEFFGPSFWQNVAASAVWGGLAALFFVLRSWLRTRHPLLTRPVVAATIAILLVGLIAYLLAGMPHPGLAGLLVALTCSGILWFELRSLGAVGILGADPTIASGLSYARALRLCKNEILFSGIGAGKLTSCEEFEAAVRRCNRPGAVKLLLLRPDSAALETAAQQANKAPDAYQKDVRASLEHLRRLRVERKLNIEVRFHKASKAPPVFRMMFIDSVVCLLSYNLWGEGDGSQLPQLHLGYSASRKRAAETFYHPFREHFNKLWDSADRWDFKAIP